MSVVILLVALGLWVLSVVSFAIGAAAPWFGWLVFAAAAILVIVGLTTLRRRIGQPV